MALPVMQSCGWARNQLGCLRETGNLQSGVCELSIHSPQAGGAGPHDAGKGCSAMRALKCVLSIHTAR